MEVVLEAPFNEKLDQLRRSKGMRKSEISKNLIMNVQHVSRLLNNSREIHPVRAIDIISYICEDQELTCKYFCEYLKQIKSPQNIRMAIEYCSTHTMLDMMDYLITKYIDDRNQEVSEFCRLYSIVYKWQKFELDAEDLYEAVKKEHAKSEDAKIILRLLEAYSLFEQKQFKFLRVVTQTLMTAIDELSNEFFKESFKIRFMELEMYIQLKVNNNPKLSRKYAKEIIQTTDSQRYKAFAYCFLGLSYSFENYDKLIKYLEISKKKYSKLKQSNMVSEVNKNIQFAQIIWDKPMFGTLETKELEAFFLIKKGHYKQGLAILNTLEETAETLYIKAHAVEDVNLFWKSLSLYKERSDKFLANYPRMELLKRNENSFIVDTLFEQN